MRLAKLRLADGSMRVAIVEDDGRLRLLDLLQVDIARSLMDVLHAPDPIGLARFLIDRDAPLLDARQVTILAPIDRQEVWAAGVTYKRSQVARMEESETGASHYDRVYTAPRPEIFFKATPNRVSGPGEPLRVRADSGWSVPEPELALVISPAGRLVGFTVGNDMSARDIEGENPLYLPQAKVYNGCCGLGPFVLIPEQPLDRTATKIRLTIEREGKTAFTGETDLGQMKREFQELIDWLTRENDLVTGAFLLTGTGIVPPDNFTLLNNDAVSIEITGIGTLSNPIVKAG
ncbi:fumarylacetoacetate hydrolase family protein [Schlesneria paludicola]|uniref:fumarylacetoacetate hydrolase family protein n=1 Tax=Schlesneria paludicola TaxID=360056 RepID=UPI00029A3956|nr:fumarylacetoacetate hydrolase family protein [Schlesneria paludicola]